MATTQQDNMPPEGEKHEVEHHDLEDYGGGTVQARHGYIPLWLMAVYFVLFVWSLYYMVVYWGGLGPGRF